MKNNRTISLSLRKVLLSALVAAPLATLPAPLWALPVNPHGNPGSSNVTSNSTTTTFLQASPTLLQITDTLQKRLVLKWGEFGSGGSLINAGETITYTLPDATSAVLNMVVGVGTPAVISPTVINGSLQSNGAIFVVNPNGITLGATARVNAAGLGLSTVNQSEFYFLANGTLDNANLASATASVSVNPNATLVPVATYGIDVGTTGNILLAGKSVDVTGVINAGTLTINTNNAAGSTGVQLAQTAALSLGINGVAATETTPLIPGTGNMTINSNGAPVVLTGVGNATNIRGGTLTINSANGNVSQNTGRLAVGDSQNDGNINITAGTGTITLGNLYSNANAPILNVTVNSAGATLLSMGTNQGDLNLRASTIAGNLTLATANGNIRSGGDTTVTGGTISLTAGGTNQRSITFKGPGDLTFVTVAGANNTAANVTLTSTTGAIVLPAMTVGGNLTVTAQTNITQTGAINVTKVGADDPLTPAPAAVDQPASRTARFDAITGSINLSTATNDFTRLVIRRAPGGATVADANSIVLSDGNSADGIVNITAPNGVTLGVNAGDVLFFNSDLNITTTNSAVAGASITAGGAYTLAPTFTAAGGVTGTATLGITSLAAPATAGSTYTAVPSVSINGGGGTGATATAVMSVAGLSVGNRGTGFTSAPTITIEGSPTGAVPTTSVATWRLDQVSVVNGGAGYVVGDVLTVGGAGGAGATATVSSVGVGGVITGVTVTAAGSAYTVIPTITGGGTGAGATFSTTGAIDTLAAIGGTNGGYNFRPTVTITGGGGTNAAVTTSLGVTGFTVTNSGSGYTNVAPATVGNPNGVTVLIGAAPSGTNAAFGTVANSIQGTVTGTAVTNGGGMVAASPGALAFTSAVGETLAGGAAGVALLGAGGGVTDASNNVSVLGALKITGPGAVVLDGATSSAIGLNHRFGPVSVNQAGSAGGVTIYESTTLNLGAINTLGTLRAYSSAGDVIDTGPVTVGRAVFGAGNAVAPGNITLDAAGNAFGGTIAFLDDYALATNGPANGAVIGTYLAKDVAITLASNISLAPVVSTAGPGIAGTLSLTATGATGVVPNGITLTGQTNVTGNVTLTAPGTVMATDNDNKIANVTVNAGGNVDVRGGGDNGFTVNAALTQNTAGRTAYFRSSNSLAIGTFNSDFTGVDDNAATSVNEFVNSVTFQAVGNNALTDNVNGMRIFGPVDFRSQGSITINNSGHAFGRVSALTNGNNGSITIVESGTLRLGTVATNGTGSFTGTASAGDIIQDAAFSGVRLGNGVTGTATLNAPLGNVTFDDNVGTTNSISRINVTAGGNVTINNPFQTALGNVTAGGFLTVNTTGGAADASITQMSGARINSFGLTTFTAQAAADILIGNSNNRMGGVVASTGTGNITLTENPTLNLISIQTAGLLAATSENASVIDSTFTALPVGVANAVGSALVPMNGTFSAPRGNVTLGLTSNYGTVGFTVGGNVSILDTAGNTTLNTSTVGGTFDVINTVGSIGQSGALTITGGVTLTAAAAGISLGNTANMLGGIRFTAGALGAQIAENATMNLRAGSSSTGAVYLTTNGNFITSGAGASSITNDLTIQAQGTIVPGTGSLLVTGSFTVFSPSLKDLSALSKSGNLLNKEPINLGAGEYKGPGI